MDKQPVLCSFTAEVVCQAVGCAHSWRAYLPEGCDDVNRLTFECPQCRKDSGTWIKWWPAEVPADLKQSEEP